MGFFRFVARMAGWRGPIDTEFMRVPPSRGVAGLLERVYLGQGHGPFVRSVLSFGGARCRYDCLPVRPLGDAGRDLAALAAEGAEASAYYKKTLAGRRHVAEAAVVLAALDRSFVIHPEHDPAPGFGRLRLDRRGGGAALPVAIDGATEPLPLDLAWMPNPLVPAGPVRTSPHGDRPFRFEWSAGITARADIVLDLLLGGDGALSLTLDGEPIVDRRNVGFTLWRERLRLQEGPHAVRLQYEARGGPGRLVLKLEAPPGG